MENEVKEVRDLETGDIIDLRETDYAAGQDGLWEITDPLWRVEVGVVEVGGKRVENPTSTVKCLWFPGIHSKVPVKN